MNRRNGIMGAADTVMVLTTETRGSETAILHITGRDVESSDIALCFDKSAARWEAVGDAGMIAAQQARQQYERNPIIRTVKALLAESPDGWTGNMKALMEAGEKVTGRQLANNPKALSVMIDSLIASWADDGIIHTRAPQGTGGGKHTFRYVALEDAPSIAGDGISICSMMNPSRCTGATISWRTGTPLCGTSTPAIGGKNRMKLTLTLLGRNSWSRPVYRGNDGNLYVDIDPRADRPPKICT